MSNQPTLLIVDDCSDDRRIYRRYLAKDPQQSYIISEAKSAEVGLSLYHEAPTDVILLDFCLPDMSGLEFLDRLIEQSKLFPLPVIMLTGQGDEAIAVQAMKRGVQDYLIKSSLNSDSLQLAVRSVLKQTLLQTQLHRTLERQRLIATTALQIRQSLEVDQILHTATVQLQGLLKCDRVLVYQFDKDFSGKVVAESVASGWTSILGTTIQDTYFQQHSGQIYCEDDQCAISSVSQANLSACYRNLLRQFEVQAHLAVPILLNPTEDTPSKLWGLLIAHQCASERDWQTDELRLFRELSVQLAIAIQQAELLYQTQTALEKQQELNVLKSQIISTVSHEYRTPLTAILAAATTLKQFHTQFDHAKRDRFLGMIEQKARHLSSLVDDMLLLQELELDRAQFKPILLDPLRFFADLIEEQETLCSDQYQFTYRITGNSKGFWGDRGLLRQIFNTLMSNAIKYSPDGGAIEVHLKCEATQISFSIRDEGIGIPLEDQDTLFQSFNRARNVGTIPGSGLGLAIARACVELHSGSIAVQSEEGQGTTFTVILPQTTTSSTSHSV
ncbi:MAG: ATP-binding protein [Leptolyngbya sp. Prado105]|jgi:signal transduction histidine kinase|nr:ATP-binding protein [Leptolyngbya sp. Prado105]